MSQRFSDWFLGWCIMCNHHITFPFMTINYVVSISVSSWLLTSVCVFYMYLLIAIFVWTGMIILKILCCPQCYLYVAKLQLLYLCLSLYSVKCTSISFCSVPVCSFWLKCCFFLCKMFYMCSFHNEFVVNKFACCILSVLKVLWAGLPNIYIFFNTDFAFLPF